MCDIWALEEIITNVAIILALLFKNVVIRSESVTFSVEFVI